MVYQPKFLKDKSYLNPKSTPISIEEKMGLRLGWLKSPIQFPLWWKSFQRQTTIIAQLIIER